MNAASAIKTPTPPYTDDIAGYLLSGGKNRRMGGRKKLFLEYNHTPFYRHILTAFQTQVSFWISVPFPGSLFRNLALENLTLRMNSSISLCQTR